MARPSGPVTGSSREVVSSGSSSFTGTSSGTSALRVPPEGRTMVTGTSGMTNLLSKCGWIELFSGKTGLHAGCWLFEADLKLGRDRGLVRRLLLSDRLEHRLGSRLGGRLLLSWLDGRLSGWFGWRRS